MVTSKGYKNIFGISSGAWEALFVIVFIIGVVSFVYGIYKKNDNKNKIEEEIKNTIKLVQKIGFYFSSEEIKGILENIENYEAKK